MWQLLALKKMKVLLDDGDVTALIGCLKCCKVAVAQDLIRRLENQAKSSAIMDRLRTIAQDEYHSDGDLEFDDGAVVSIDDSPNQMPEGAYVMGWKWIPNPEKDEAPKPFVIESLGCEVRGLIQTTYANSKATAILLKLHWPAKDGEPEQDEEHPVTVNLVDPVGGLPSHELLPDQFYAKSWSENEAIYAALTTQGIIEQIGSENVRTGHVLVPLCRLTDRGEKWVEVKD